MSRRLLANAVLIDPLAVWEEPGALLLEDGRIRERFGPGDPEPDDVERVDLGGRAVAPGFLDLHHHGGWIFLAPDQIAASLARTAASLLRHGTTGFLPTTVAWPAADLLPRVTTLTDHASQSATQPAAEILGLHLEGPWIRPEAAGAQPPKGIRPYDEREAREVLDRGEGCIRLVTLAPEVPGSEALLAELGRRGIVAALGHSLATAPEIEQGIAAGLRHVTHLFNAMGGLHHRERGVAGVALADDRLTCDLICDGVHVHPDVVRVAARAKGRGLVLITDQIEAPPDDAPGFGSGRVIDDGTALRLPDGTLAGSSLTLDRAIQNAVAYQAMTRLEAVAACTSRPARLLGIESEHGTFAPGSRADLVVLDDADRVAETWLAGDRVYSAA